MLWKKGRSAPLYKISAHGDHNIISVKLLADLIKLIFMACVKGIVFGNDTYSFHEIVPHKIRLYGTFYHRNA